MNNYFLVGTILTMIPGICTLVIGFYYRTFLHELGHLKTARRYKFTGARITLKRKIFIPSFARPKRCIIRFNKKMKGNGRTDLENNYLEYSVKQIKHIAVAGMLGSITATVIVYVVSTLFTYILMYALSYPILAMPAGFGLGVHIAAILVNLMFFFLSPRDNGWYDLKIYKEPEKYLEYLKEEVKKIE